jgi:hypothetical protein
MSAKLGKYYNLDECLDKDLVFEKLDYLQGEAKIEFEEVEDNIIKIADTGLFVKEKKELLNFFKDNDVLEDLDYDDDEDLDEEDDLDDFIF